MVNGACVVTLPDYISSLVKEEEINVQITNIRHSKVIWVDGIDISNNQFTVGTDQAGSFDFYWSFTAIRKDIPDLVVEYTHGG